MSSEHGIWWPSVPDVQRIHRLMMLRSGDPPAGCDAGKLDGALKRPQWLLHYEGIEDVVELGVALATAIAVSHAFSDGNKRTGLSVLAIFLRRNGLELVGQSGSTILGEHIEAIVLGHQASSERGEQMQRRFGDFLRTVTRARSENSR